MQIKYKQLMKLFNKQVEEERVASVTSTLRSNGELLISISMYRQEQGIDAKVNFVFERYEDKSNTFSFKNGLFIETMGRGFSSGDLYYVPEEVFELHLVEDIVRALLESITQMSVYYDGVEYNHSVLLDEIKDNFDYAMSVL